MVCLLAACGPSAAGLSQEQAVAAAKATAQGISSTPVTFVSAASGRFGDLAPGPDTAASDANRQVWAGVFRGSFRGSCGPYTTSPRPCPPPNTTIRVVLDYGSGAMIWAETPARTA